VTKYSKRKLTPEETFIKLHNGMMETPAWQAMSLGARCLYIELKRKCRTDCRNNGSVFLSQRNAQKVLGSKRDQIARWYRELQHFGFIELTRPGFLGIEGKGVAAHWRLTELPYNGAPPTRDYERWDGSPFPEFRKKSRSRKQDHNPGPEKGTITRSRKQDHNGSKIPVPKKGPHLEEASTHTTGGPEAAPPPAVRS
jgi:hypothetical protein